VFRVKALASLLVCIALGATVGAQGRTDVVTLTNGDRITGEVVRLERGRLEFKTDDEGTIYFEWDIVARVTSKDMFEVVTTEGNRYLGTLTTDIRGTLVVAGIDGEASLPLMDVTVITAIGRSFWQKLDGSVDIGFSYTKSSAIAQLNVNSSTVYRRPAFEGRLTASGTLTKSEDGERDDRATVQASYVRYRGQRWFVAGAASLESNESLGLRLRSQVAGSIGPRLVNTNRAYVTAGAGLSVNHEEAVDAESTDNLESMFTFRTSYFSYDRPKTNVDVSFQYFPSLSNWGRQRIQLDAAVKREIWKDVFIAVNLFDTFDSRPPNPDSHSNDVGVVLSFGWSY
jgi:hypothetical protein